MVSSSTKSHKNVLSKMSLYFKLCFLMLFVDVVLCNGSNSNYTTIYVDPSGYGNYKTIQEAIDSVPQNNQNWICIEIKAGTYREQIRIPREKPYIYLKGDGRSGTEVVWDGHGTIETGTLICDADNIFFKSLTFINSYNFPPENTTNPREVAVAATLNGDKIALYRCGFKGWQDTLWDNQGRHFFKKCFINGAVDFIFGNGQSIYEKCTISVDRGEEEQGLVGYITAQSRQDPTDWSGFVFKDCYVKGTSKAYLGRPWRDFARVIFFNTYMEDNIDPQGWTVTDPSIKVDNLTFVEQGCRGPGSNKSKRVKWLKWMIERKLHDFTTLSYINRGGWLFNLPPSKILDDNN